MKIETRLIPRGIESRSREPDSGPAGERSEPSTGQPAGRVSGKLGIKWYYGETYK